jgi:hypothetical protein
MNNSGKEILFNDIFQKPVKFTKNIRKVKSVIRGNVRLSCGLYYTDEEKEEYINKSLSRELP